MRKKLLFLWSLLSLAGFILGLNAADGFKAFYIDEFLYTWAMLSVPLIIHLLYIKIFSEE